MIFRLFGLGFKNFWIFVFLFIFGSVVIFFEVKITRLEDSRNHLESTVGRLLRANNAMQSAAIANPLWDLRKSTERDMIIIYNRVPKTASTSFVNVAYDICKKNKFNVLHLNITGNLHVMSLSDQSRFVRNVTQWYAKKPALYHGHVAFVDFERFGISQQPIYINILRKPLDRLVSYYYFLRFGDNYRPHLVRRKHGDKMTFDECVKQKQPDCNPDNMWLQIPFLCGHAAACWKPGNIWALEQAKNNLVQHYLLVGVTEELPDFIAMLEFAVPSFFHGAIQHFKSSKKAHLRKTNEKIEPSEETVAEIQKSEIWQMENELYEFALKQFHFLKKKMGLDSSGVVSDKGQQFMYEKIIPK
uniref:Heparan sulfate 2-O-sulfotransferase 1 n=2 Tax=Clastoptera arizonana TaxID=38151 RepID=A0A1B6C0H2_9HEMI